MPNQSQKSYYLSPTSKEAGMIIQQIKLRFKLVKNPGLYAYKNTPAKLKSIKQLMEFVFQSWGYNDYFKIIRVEMPIPNDGTKTLIKQILNLCGVSYKLT